MRPFIVGAAASLIAMPASAQSTCNVQGVWQLVSGTADGKPYPAGAREMKIIAKGHFAFLSQEPGVPSELKSVADSLATYRHTFSGGGTYTVKGTTYTETIEYFADPGMVGKSVAFTCRIEGDKFYQSGNYPIYSGGKKVRDSKLEEVWKRVE